MMNYDMAVEYFCSMDMYRILMTDAHHYFKNKIASFQTDHEHETRTTSLDHKVLPSYKCSKCQRSFLYVGLKFWNKLPYSTRNIPNNPKCFKNALKKYIFDQI